MNRGSEEGRKKYGFDFYTVVIWKDDAARDEAHKELGLDENRYQSGAILLEILRGPR